MFEVAGPSGTHFHGEMPSQDPRHRKNAICCELGRSNASNVVHTLPRQTLPAELPVPSDSRMIRVFAIRTLARIPSSEAGIFITPSEKFLRDLALHYEMGLNCVVRLPTVKDDARDPLMWNAAHSCALR